ncbi:MAG: pantoate--beta-alanine ligase, partial [Myxococcota bacterium]
MERRSDIPSVKAYLRARQAQGLRVGLVPTMGALHDGHLSLVRFAKARADIVVATVFVNPKQFGPSEDLSRYPRDLEGDAQKLASAGCDLLFLPDIKVMYPEGFKTTVSVRGVTEGLCGSARPGHFDGVTTVVLKLFSIVRPDVAVFGEKDYQQLIMIRAMVRDLDMPVEIIGAPIIRAAAGTLALSSRNRYLSVEDMDTVTMFPRILQDTAVLIEALRHSEQGATRETLRALTEAAKEILLASGIPSIDYIEVRHADTLEKPNDCRTEPLRLLAAVRIGGVR